jgi:hypothetical protein
MAVTLETVDKVVGLPEIKGPELTFTLDRVTAREIVRARVRAECERIAEGGSIFSDRVAPDEREVLLNGARRQHATKPEVDHQIEVALAAIEAGRVIVLFNGRQVTDIDAPLAVAEFSTATFIRLVPLAGG